MCLPLSARAKATPLMAWLMDSVPPEVKTISWGTAQWIRPATDSRALSRAAAARSPILCWLEGLPKFVRSASIMASCTSGSRGLADR